MGVASLRDAMREAVRLAACSVASWVVEELRRLASLPGVEGLYYGALLRSVELSVAGSTPVCQDTGTPILLVEEYGWASHREAEESLAEALREAEGEGLLRPNRVSGVIPGIRYVGQAPVIMPLAGGGGEEEFRATLLLRGGGAEYYSRAACTATIRAAREAWDWAERLLGEADGRPCPPLILAMGAGPSVAEAVRQAYTALAGVGGWRRARPPRRLEPGGEPLPVKPRLLAVLGSAAPSHPACTCIALLTQCWALRGARIRVSRDGGYRVEPL